MKFLREQWSAILRLFSIGILILIGGFILVWSGHTYIDSFIKGSYSWEFILIFLVASYFPFSYLTYYNFRSPQRLDLLRLEFQKLRLKDDFSNNQLADKLYKATQTSSRYLIHIFLTMYIVIIGASLFFWLPASELFPITIITALQFGFIGAYLFSVQLVYRRYTTNDLEPSVYMYCWLTIIAGFGFNFVIFKTFVSDNSTSSGVEAGLLGILAFALGYYPSLALKWLNRLTYKALSIDQRRSDSLPLSLIDGISEFHETRLHDNGIDNIQNLVSADIHKLLVNTPFTGQQIVDWIDQATLFLYLPLNEVQNFHGASVRSITNFRSKWHFYQVASEEHSQIRRDFAQQVRSTPERLDTLYELTETGPNLHHILSYWTNAQMMAREVQKTSLELIPYYTVLLEDIGRFYVDDLDINVELVKKIELAENLRIQIYNDIGADPEERSGAAMVGRALIFIYRREIERAIEKLSASIERYPGYVLTYKNLVRVSPAKLDRILHLARQLSRLSNVTLNQEEFKDYVDTLEMLEKLLLSQLEIPVSSQHRIEIKNTLDQISKLRQSRTIFISYVHRDSSALAALIDAKLEQNGFIVVLDRKLSLGDDDTWDAIIAFNIQKSRYFICIISPNLDNSYAIKEIRIALRHKIQVIPILSPQFYSYSDNWKFDQVESDENIFFKQLLDSVQAIRIQEESAEAYNDAINKLLNTLKYQAIKI